MKKYTLKTFYGFKELERYNHRSSLKLVSILSHPQMDRAREDDGWGNLLGNANRFEIFDSRMEKLFEGNISSAIDFAKRLP